MARPPTLDIRLTRSCLAPRREPYWEVIAKGRALGYRKGATGGTWIARCRGTAGSQHYHALGAADDGPDCGGLSHADARRQAEAWFDGMAAAGAKPAAPSAPYTVKAALDDYLATYRRKGGKSAERMQRAVEALIVPALGAVPVAELSRLWVEGWHQGLSRTAPRLRTRPGKPQKFRTADDGPDAIRRRR